MKLGKYLIKKDPVIISYAILQPVKSFIKVSCAFALSAAIDYAMSGKLADIGKYIITFAALILASFLADAADQWLLWKVHETRTAALRRDAVKKLLLMPFNRFSEKSSSDYISNITEDVDEISKYYFRTFLYMFGDLVIFIFTFVSLLRISQILGIFALAVCLLQTLVPFAFKKSQEKASEESSDASEDHYNTLDETLSAYSTGKVFGIEDKLNEKYNEVQSDAAIKDCHNEFLRTAVGSTAGIFTKINHLGIFLFGAVLAVKGYISIAEIIGAAQLISYLSGPVNNINEEIADIRSCGESVDKLDEILSTPSDNGGNEEITGDSSITVSDLHFSYDTKEVLSGINMEFHAGEKYLITGESGCGKSTLMNVIGDILPGYTGKVKIGGCELKSISRKSLAEKMCIINQEPFIFDDSIYNNVALFEDYAKEDVKAALIKAGLGEFLSKQENGVDTLVGENAEKMSGGEKQRLAIARALVRRSSILLLDETTSHLDPETAADIEKTILSLQGVTVFLVSHNATNVAKEEADQVLVMDNGALRAA